MKSLLTPEDLKQQVILKKRGSLYLTTQHYNIFFSDEVYVLVLNKPGNSFSTDFIRKINDKLDEVENSDGPACLVTVSTDLKCYSTGLDLR